MFAAHHKVDNIIVTIDFNGQQIDGSTREVAGIGEDIEAKVKAFGWDVLRMEGHHMEDIIKVMGEAKARMGKGKPIFIMMHTEMGYPIDFMMGSHKWHGVAPNDEELARALAQIPATIGDY
jgi:transketolase